MYTILSDDGEIVTVEQALSQLGKPPEDTDTLHMFDENGNVIVKY